MSRSARRREPEIGFAGRLAGGLALSGMALARNPVLVGGTTAFLVTMFYVSANAIWYQPGAHRDAVFATRPFLDVGTADDSSPEPETLIRLEREAEVPEPAPRPQPAAEEAVADPVMIEAQKELARLGLYGGDLDGLPGPRTRHAIANYEEKIGLPVTGELNNRTLTELLGRPPMAQPDALPQVSSEEAGRDDAEIRTASVNAGDPIVSQVQAGLRAFGNDHIEIDGRMGPATSAAIREFQTLFGLQVSGEISDQLVSKMREVGLTN